MYEITIDKSSVYITDADTGESYVRDARVQTSRLNTQRFTEFLNKLQTVLTKTKAVTFDARTQCTSAGVLIIREVGENYRIEYNREHATYSELQVCCTPNFSQAWVLSKIGQLYEVATYNARQEARSPITYNPETCVYQVTGEGHSIVFHKDMYRDFVITQCLYDGRAVVKPVGVIISALERTVYFDYKGQLLFKVTSNYYSVLNSIEEVTL